jgi:hypothetical protein
MHTIRLRGPWQYEVLDAPDPSAGTTGGPSSRSGRIRLPSADWSRILAPDYCGRILLRRSFARPTGLTGQSVYLAISAVAAAATVTLNDQPLASIRPHECPLRLEITGDLQPRNVLELVFELAAQPNQDAPHSPADSEFVGILLGEVRLEIAPV